MINNARQIQFVAKVGLSEPSLDECFFIFLRAYMQLVRGTNLSQSVFLAVVVEMLNTFFTFTASGSGWLLDRIVEIDVKFATFSPIRGSSFLLTPPLKDGSH